MNHPILAAASDIRSLLKGVAGANPAFMSTSEKAEALRELVAAEAQLVELRLRVLADAGDLGDATGAKDAAGWLAHQTRTRFADARADLALAATLDRERPVLAAGMRDGAVTLAQAHVIPGPLMPFLRPWMQTQLTVRRRTWWDVRRSSGPRSWVGSGVAFSTWLPRRSRRPLGPLAWPIWKQSLRTGRG